MAEALALPGPRAPLSGPYAALVAVVFSGLPMVAWSVLVDKVAYRDETPWPAGADGLGFSLQRNPESVPGVDPAAGQLTSKVATLFLSRSSSGGALLARLTGPLPANGTLAHLTLRYQTVDLGVVTQQLDALAPSGPPPAFAEPGVEKTVALARFVELAKAACGAHHAGDGATARQLADEAIAVLTQARASTGDAALDAEVQLATALRALLDP